MPGEPYRIVDPENNNHLALPTEILAVSLVGGSRFPGEIAIDGLKVLVEIQAIVRKIAAIEWQKANGLAPSADQLEAMSLALSDVRPGSGVGGLRIPINGEALFKPLVATAVSIFLAGALSIASGSLHPTLPRAVQAEIAEITKPLKHGESVGFATVGQTQVFYLDDTALKPMRAVTKPPPPAPRPVVLPSFRIGQIDAFSLANTEITFLHGGQKLKVKPSRVRLLELMEATVKQPNGVVAVSGSLSGKTIVSTEITIVDRLSDYDTRFDELRRLVPGWLDGTGVPPSQLALMRAESLAPQLVHRTGRVAYLYATEDGGVQLEWDIATWQVTVVIDASGQLEAFATNPDGSERDLDFAR